jgi:antitoxin VapB
MAVGDADDAVGSSVHTGAPMALNLRNPGVERLVATVGRVTGETKTEAVRAALADRLARLERERTGRSLADELDEGALAYAALPVVDERDPDDIPGYDGAGLPACWSSTPRR